MMLVRRCSKEPSSRNVKFDDAVHSHGRKACEAQLQIDVTRGGNVTFISFSLSFSFLFWNTFIRLSVSCFWWSPRLNHRATNRNLTNDDSWRIKAGVIEYLQSIEND